MMVHAKSCGIIPFYASESGIEFLILKNKDSKWSFPKGTVERDESEVQTALRECKEEVGITNIEVTETPSFMCISEEDGGAMTILKRTTHFLGMVSSKEVDIDTGEISDFKWVAFADAKNYLESEVFEVLQEANNFLLNKK